MSRAAVAFLAGLGGGYAQASRQADLDAEARKDAEIRREGEQLRLRQARQAEDDAISLRRAAAPVGLEVLAEKPDTMDNRDVSADGEMVLKPTGYRVGGQTFADRGQADIALAKANTPEAADERVALAMREMGKPLEAMQYRAAMTSQKASALQLQQQQFARDAATALHTGGWEGLGKFMSESRADGNDYRVVPDGTGKVTVQQVSRETGEAKPLRSYTDDDAGRQEAFMGLMAAVKPEMLAQHYRWKAEEQRRARDQTLKAEKLASDVTNATEKLRLMGEAITAKGEAAKAKADAGEKPPAGYRRTPDGNLEPIPGGPADQKVQGQFNADSAALTGAISSFDRLAEAANALRTHPGLKGITGLRGALPNVPGSDAADAQALLNTLKSQVAFGVLQDMRNQSKTGGALGAVSEKELALLQNNLAALEKAQSIEQMSKGLDDILKYSEAAKDRMRGAFNMRHPNKPSGGEGAGAVAAGTAPSNIPRVASPADAAKLPRGSLFMGPDGKVRRVP